LQARRKERLKNLFEMNAKKEGSIAQTPPVVILVTFSQLASRELENWKSRFYLPKMLHQFYNRFYPIIIIPSTSKSVGSMYSQQSAVSQYHITT